MKRPDRATRATETGRSRIALGLSSHSALSFDVPITGASALVRHAPPPRLTPDSVPPRGPDGPLQRFCGPSDIALERPKHDKALPVRGRAARRNEANERRQLTALMTERSGASLNRLPLAKERPNLIKARMNTNILILSRDPSVRQAAREALADGGFDLVLAHDGYEALDHLSLAAVEVAVLDLEYTGKDMWDVVEWLLETQPLTSLVFLASTRAGTEWTLVTTFGVTLEKPVAASRLTVVVRQVLDEPPSRRRGRIPCLRMALRYLRPYAYPDPAAYSGWGIND